MKIIKSYNQHRRDLIIDIKCESCSSEETYEHAYDDNNFWQNVVPAMKCKKCGNSTNSLGLEPAKVKTKYEPWEII